LLKPTFKKQQSQRLEVKILRWRCNRWGRNPRRSAATRGPPSEKEPESCPTCSSRTWFGTRSHSRTRSRFRTRPDWQEQCRRFGEAGCKRSCRSLLVTGTGASGRSIRFV